MPLALRLLIVPAALVATIAIAAAASAQIRADESSLQPTEITAQIPITPDTPFPLRWGGGSLHHLKARLATLGCIADLIWAYDETSAQWRPYSQYRAPTSLNQPFLDDFREHLPAGDLYATCFDPCEFRYFDDPPDAAIRCGAHPTNLSQLERADWSGGVPFGFGEPCTDDWHPTVAERVLPDLPRHPAACVIHTPTVAHLRHRRRLAAARRQPLARHLQSLPVELQSPAAGDG